MKEATAYPSYKNSGSEWLGDIPAHWDVKRGAAFLLEKRKKNDPLVSENYLSLMANRGIIPYAEKGDVGNKKPDDLTKCKIVSIGDFVINSMNYAIGSYGVSNYDGICSPVYVVMSHNPKVVTPEYVDLILSNSSYQKYAQSFGTGILDHRRAIGWDEIKKIPVAIPPIDEQVEIASHIREKTTRIDSLIEKKTRFIELLKEKRQAVITNAVTKGLDPSVAMKDSGLKSIGQIPAHWDLSPISRSLQLKKRLVGSQSANYKLLSLTTRGIIERDVSENFGKFPESFDTYQEVNSGDFVFCLFDIDETPRTVGLSQLHGMITGAYAVFETKETDHIQYLLNLFTHIDDCKGLKPFYSGLRKTIRPPRFTSIRLPFPPKDEASNICSYIDRQNVRITTVIQKTERSIDLLKEHRSALITAAVTGKIDVRKSK